MLDPVSMSNVRNNVLLHHQHVHQQDRHKHHQPACSSLLLLLLFVLALCALVTQQCVYAADTMPFASAEDLSNRRWYEDSGNPKTAVSSSPVHESHQDGFHQHNLFRDQDSRYQRLKQVTAPSGDNGDVYNPMNSLVLFAPDGNGKDHIRGAKLNRGDGVEGLDMTNYKTKRGYEISSEIPKGHTSDFTNRLVGGFHLANQASTVAGSLLDQYGGMSQGWAAHHSDGIEGEPRHHTGQKKATEILNYVSEKSGTYADFLSSSGTASSVDISSLPGVSSLSSNPSHITLTGLPCNPNDPKYIDQPRRCREVSVGGHSNRENTLNSKRLTNNKYSYFAEHRWSGNRRDDEDNWWSEETNSDEDGSTDLKKRWRSHKNEEDKGLSNGQSGHGGSREASAKEVKKIWLEEKGGELAMFGYPQTKSDILKYHAMVAVKNRMKEEEHMARVKFAHNPYIHMPLDPSELLFAEHHHPSQISPTKITSKSQTHLISAAALTSTEKPQSSNAYVTSKPALSVSRLSKARSSQLWTHSDDQSKTPVLQKSFYTKTIPASRPHSTTHITSDSIERLLPTPSQTLIGYIDKKTSTGLAGHTIPSGQESPQVSLLEPSEDLGVVVVQTVREPPLAQYATVRPRSHQTSQPSQPFRPIHKASDTDVRPYDYVLSMDLPRSSSSLLRVSSSPTSMDSLSAGRLFGTNRTDASRTGGSSMDSHEAVWSPSSYKSTVVLPSSLPFQSGYDVSRPTQLFNYEHSTSSLPQRASSITAMSAVETSPLGHPATITNHLDKSPKRSFSNSAADLLAAVALPMYKDGHRQESTTTLKTASAFLSPRDTPSSGTRWTHTGTTTAAVRRTFDTETESRDPPREEQSTEQYNHIGRSPVSMPSHDSTSSRRFTSMRSRSHEKSSRGHSGGHLESASSSNTAEVQYSAHLGIQTFRPKELKKPSPPPAAPPTAEEVAEHVEAERKSAEDEIRQERRRRRKQEVTYAESLRMSMANPSGYAPPPTTPVWRNQAREAVQKKEQRDTYTRKIEELRSLPEYEKLLEDEQRKIIESIEKKRRKEINKRAERKEKTNKEFIEAVEDFRESEERARKWKKRREYLRTLIE
eukprot:GHVQ01033589.1.p1 GENE.GHVQ01033589.1~~GHVQ01033589.1.p1  ORF type:complete len:1098 (-),score=227.71 GHVQ01033589.1:145-3438(-)